ncbi:hypothetical protein PGT21_036236 [Puccinia graminis f. sp. tritici]|uniref:Uncharacterized protein n=1 Tax=Puccinia graminis f. sp. tritici TaxID=56615 RepID=A0A5B0MHX1_PUCGR|nr:hypothetical protein PGTUg99_037445 [Puccinia graminis f. sp. tritici]KAA1091615.1 hypothetical protein PGT21_036236 [Puccinia graminis f. sp. tritici]
MQVQTPNQTVLLKHFLKMFDWKLITLVGIVTRMTLNSVIAPPSRPVYLCPTNNCGNHLTVTWCNYELPCCNIHCGKNLCPVPLVG